MYSGEPGNSSDMNQTEKIRRLQDAARDRVEGTDGSKVGGGLDDVPGWDKDLLYLPKTLSQASLLAF